MERRLIKRYMGKGAIAVYRPLSCDSCVAILFYLHVVALSANMRV